MERRITENNRGLYAARVPTKEEPSALDQGRDCVVPGYRVGFVPGVRTCSLLTRQPQGVKKTPA